MFPLHDRTRRFLCRAGFLIGGVLPMIAVLAWSASIHTSGYREAFREELEAALGLDVRFDSIAYPRPGITLLSNVDVSDPATGETLLHARLLEISGSGPSVSITASQPEIYAAQLGRLWPAVAKRLQAREESNQSIVRVGAAELTLHWPQGVHTLVDFAAQLEPDEAGRMATVTFSSAGASMAKPARLCVLRKNSSDPSTTLKCDTGGSPLPCSLLAALLHRDNRLGINSTFQGAVWAEQTSAGWQGELAAQIEQIDLNSVISEQFPHQLSGTASITIDMAKACDGRLEEAKGTIHAGPGVISQSLLKSAAVSLHMNASGTGNTSEETLAYDELAAAFALDAKGLKIQGCCHAGENGVVLNSGSGALLTEATAGPGPISALVQALVPDSRLQVPATRQTDWLLNALPLPDVQPRDPHSAPNARLRGGPELH